MPTQHDMDIDTTEEKFESADEIAKPESNCPSIKIERSADQTLPVTSSQEDTATEEKNDSGIR